MIKGFLLTICIFFSLYSFGQEFPSEIWHEGKIVLIEGDTLTGKVRYSQETEIVEYIGGGMGTAIALTGRKILYFEIFDNTVGRYREFYALPYAINNDYETPILFEVIYEGKPLTLLSREKIEYQVINNPYTMGGSYTRTVLNYTYYFLTEKNGIKRFNGSKKDLEYLLSDRSQLIKKYIKQERIRPEKRSDIMKVVFYYNSLFESKKSPEPYE